MTSRRTIPSLVLSIVTIGLHGQNAATDKKITEIESFRKYVIIRIDNYHDLKLQSDSAIEIIEVVNYKRKDKNNLLGKVTETARTKAGEIKRTYYFNDQSSLFAIVDHLKTIDNAPRKLTYYFGSGQLTKVIDEGKNDVTNTIDKQRLYYWIRRMFGDQIIAK